MSARSFLSLLLVVASSFACGSAPEDVDSTDQAAVARGTLGARCEKDVACGAKLVCIKTSADAPSGLCEEPRKNDARCARNEECVSKYCQPGPRTCAPLRGRVDGEPCAGPDGATTCRSEYCDFTASCDTSFSSCSIVASQSVVGTCRTSKQGDICYVDSWYSKGEDDSGAFAKFGKCPAKTVCRVAEVKVGKLRYEDPTQNDRISRCLPPGSSGQMCDRDSDCAAGLLCNFDPNGKKFCGPPPIGR